MVALVRSDRILVVIPIPDPVPVGIIVMHDAGSRTLPWLPPCDRATDQGTNVAFGVSSVADSDPDQKIKRILIIDCQSN